MAKIKFKRTSIPGRKPSDLLPGEIAINLNDRKIYAGNDSGSIVQLGNDPIITEHLQAKAGASIENGLNVGGNASVQGDLNASGGLVSLKEVKAPQGEIDAIIAKTITTGSIAGDTGTFTGKVTHGETKTGALEATTANITGAATVHSLMTPGSVSAGGNIVATGKLSGGSVESPVIITTDITATDINTATVTATGKAKSGSVETGSISGSDITLTGKAKTGSVETGNISATGTATVHNLVITGSSNVTGGVNASGKLVGSSLETPLITTTDVNTKNVTAAGTLTAPTVQAGALSGSSLNVTATATAKTVKADNVETIDISATGNLTAGSVVAVGSAAVGTTLNVTGKATLGSVGTGAVSATGITTGTLTATGATVLKGVTSGSISATGDVTASGRLKGATGEITSLVSNNIDAVGLVKAGTLQANSIALTNFDNFDARYIKVGTSMTTAERLATPRTIAGVAFDGSANISIPAANVGALPVAGGTMNGPIAFNVSSTDPVLVGLSNNATGSKCYLTKFRGGAADTIWHQTVQGGVYRLATGTTDTQEELQISTAGYIRGRNEIQSSSCGSGGQFRAVQGNYGFFIRNDGGNTYFMLTESGSPWGTWGSLRPLTISNTTGRVSMSNGLNSTDATFTGAVTVNGTVNCTAATIMMQSNQRRHIQFNNGTSTDGYIYKDVNGGWMFNNGVNTGSWSMGTDGKFTSSGAIQAGAGVAVGGALTGATTGAFSGLITASGGLTTTGLTANSVTCQGNMSVVGTASFSGALNSTGGISIAANRGISSNHNQSMILNDHGNGNVTLCAARTSSTATTGGELHLGYNASAGTATGGGFYTARIGTYAPLYIRTGAILNDQNNSWIVARDSSNALRCNMLTTSSAGMMVVQKHADHTFTLGGLGNSQFGIYRYLNSRTDNGNDGYAVMAVDNTWTCSGNGNFNDVYIRSDKRLKTNLVKIESALDKVNKLNGYSYDKKFSLDATEYTEKEDGLIAQELREVLPNSVNEDKETSVLTISGSGVNALLVEAIKELTARVKELEAK
ncbi:phage tail fiber protein [Enterobacter kobei]|uniref:phage tail fiber protein n=1 Tax=Enterobacter kobei TaxID=208224 RepID=UPI002DBB84FF|nr:tail fiber domain-containing protein [Enterobacter kobei]MEB7604983.1 tail fiber domain-containing protein [Enterobacter kobei]HCD2819199.1 tail fiber domain-containing protein [Enterobacter hormaechei]